MDDYKIIVEQDNSTVVGRYETPKRDGGGYQSEARLEAEFIKQLVGQGYEYAKQVKNEIASIPVAKGFVHKKNRPYCAKDKDLETLVMEIQYYTQRLYFGKYAENYFNERKSDFKEKSLLEADPQLLEIIVRLPEMFRRTDVENISGMRKTCVCSMLNRMCYDGYIIKVGKSRNTLYKKTDKLSK